MKYIWNNNEYTQEDIDAALEATGQDLDTYLSENKIEVLEVEEEEKTNKQKRIEKREEKKLAKTEDVAESADVASEAPAQENTVSEQESISLELPEEIKPVEIAQTDIKVEQPEDDSEIEVDDTDPPISILERLRRKKLQKEQAKQKALGIVDDVDFDLTYNDMQKNNRKVKKLMQDNGFTNVVTVDQIPEEEKENYAKWNKENTVEIPNSEIIGYATKEFVEEGFKVDYKSPDILSFLDAEKQAELDKLEGERLDQAKFVKLQETTDGLNEEVQQLQQSLENLNEGDLDYKKVINQINEINKQINSNNEELTQQFAYPDYEEGEMRFDKITPIYRTLDGRIYTSKNAGFYDVPLPEAIRDSDQPGGTISISQEVEDQAIRDQTFTYNSRIKNALTTGEDKIIIPNAEKIKLDDVRKPEQLIENIFNDPQLSYDFLNVSNVPVNLKQNTSAKLFNETFEAYGFVAIENSDDKSIDIYYRPEYNPVQDKDGNLIEQGFDADFLRPVGFMDVYTQQASVKDGQTPIASYSVNTEEYREEIGRRQPGILGLTGPFARRRSAGDSYEDVMYLDNAQRDLGNFSKSSQSVKDAMLKSIQNHKDQSGYDQAYINTDSLDAGLTPSPALVMATEEQTKGYMNSIISNSKVIENVRSKIEKDYGQIEKDSKPLKEINDAVSSLSEDQEYIETNNNLKELNKSITKQNDRFVEINTILKEADPDGDGQVDAKTFERIKPLIEEQKKISADIKQLQDQAKPMINLINKKLKPYEKSNKNFEKAWKNKGFESGEEYRVDLQTRFNDVDTRLNEDYKTLIEQTFLQEDFLEDANSSLMRSTATFMDWAEHTTGRGDFLKYTVNRAKNGVKDIVKGGVGTVFDLMNAANRLASDDPEAANDYWEAAKKRARDIADENFRQKWNDPDIDDFYIKDFESTMPGQAYGVFVDMMVDMGFGFLATGGAMSLGVGLSAGARISEGIETEIENIEEESKFLKEENGNFVFKKDANGNNIIGEDGKFVKVENPNYKPLSPNEKLAYKSAIVIGTTILEKIGFESLGVFSKGKVANYIVGQVLKGGKKLNPLTFGRLVRREVSNLTKQGFFKFVTGVGGEVVTELSQDGLDMLGKFTANSWREGDQFDFFDKQQFDQDTYNRWYETAAVTMLATAPLAGIGGGISMIQQANLEKASVKKIATFSAFAKTPELRKAYQTQQEQLFVQNKISKKQLELNLETLSNVSGILESLPDNLSSKAQKTVLQLELEISDLKKQKTENGPASSAIQEEIKNREQAIEQVVKEDQAAGGMKAELLQKKVVASQAIKNIQEQNPDGEVIVLDDSNREEVTNEYKLDEKQKKEFKNSGVFIDNDDANGVILIDKDAAIDVIVHEDRHQFLSKILKDPKNEGGVFALANLIENQLNALPNNSQNLRAKQKINYLREQYEKDPKYTASMLAEELVMFFGDAIDDTSNEGMFKLDLNEGILSGVSRNIRTMFRNTFNIPVQIRNERDLIDLIKEHRKAVVDGVDSKRMQAVRAGLVTFDGDKLQQGLEIQERKEKQREQQLKDIKQDESIVIEEEVPVPPKQSKQIKDVLDVIVQEPNGERKFQTQEEFQSDPEASFTAYNAIQNTNLLDGTINQIISSDKALSEAVSLANNPEEVRNDIIRKVKENVSLRVLKNFDPSKNESLFGYLLGKNPIVNKSLLDVKKDYAKAPTSRGGNTRLQQQVEDGPQFDLVDETIDIEGDIDRQDEAVPRSTMKQALPSIVNQELEDAIETAVLEVEAGVKPDVMDKDFKSFIKEVLDEKLTPKLKQALGTGKTYEENIKKIAPKLKQMPTKFFVNLESQVKPENRVFTNPPKRLTKQSDIDKAMLDDKVYVENTAQGVNSYTLKNFTTEDLLKNIFPPLTNPKTGARSGARGNKKTQVSSGLAVELGKDMIPSIFKPATDPKVMAQVGRKIQRDPRALFKKGFSTKDVNDLILAAEASDINAAGVIAGLPRGSITVTNSNRATKIKQVLNDIKTFGLSLNVFESSMPASAGAVREQVNKRKSDGNLTPDAKRLNAYLKKNKIKAKDGVYFYELTNGNWVESVPAKKKDGSIGKGVTYPDGVTNLLPSRGRLYYGKEDPNYITALEAAQKNTDKNALIPKKVSVRERITKAFINKFKQRSQDNMQVLEDVAFELNDAVNVGVEEINELGEKTGKIIKMPASTAALIIAQGYQATGGLIKISAPFTQVSTDFNYGPEGSKQGNKNKRPFIEEHNPPASTIGASLIWAIANNKTREIFPFIRKNYFQTQLSKADDFLLDMAKLDKRLPKGFSILDDSIIRLSEAGINLNKQIDPVTGKSLAENFGLGVAPSVNAMPNVVALQRQLIRDVILGGDLKTAQQTLADYTKFPTNNNPSLAQTQNNANKNTNISLKQSKVLDVEGDLSMGELLSKAAGIDAALKNANALDKPIKKIRVFDFDDTLATSNNKVFATRGNERVEMNAEKFATDAAQMIEDGWTMDFSDFDNVTEGGRGPLFKVAQTIKEARGNEDLFVLTARGPNAETAIYDFLKAEGLEFKRENIVGLGKSQGEAKANWIIDKAAEGYNDFYFADDAPQNVEAVRTAMSQLDVKSKVQLAKENKINFSEKKTKELDWKTDEAGNIKTTFNIGKKKYNFNLDARDTKGSFDVEFNLDGRIDMTGTGDAIKVIRTVYNGLLDIVGKTPKIKRLEFSSLKSETSRVKLYTTLMDKVAKKLGWETDVWESNNFIAPEKSSYDFEITKPRKKQVAPVEKVLNVIDVKSKVQQAKVKQSKQLSEDFNKLLEESTGVEFFKEYSPAKARTIGAGKGKFKFFIPYSAEDLTGLLYTTLAKGSKGDAQMAWYKENLIDPYARAIESLRASRINMMDDFRQLKKSLNVPKDLRKKNDSGFTNEQAVRVYLWNKSGKKVPGLSNADLKELSDAIENNTKLKLFADQLQALTKEEEYTDPSESWLAGSITGDLIDIINKEKRSKFLAESGYTDNVNAMFSKENLNKLEALYGTKYREAMENILARMKAGRNRLETGNRLSNQVLDYINGSVGAVMFFNTRSAVLQTISAVNFMNWSFNNPIQAGKAFANQPQYWKDFTMLMNSTYLRDRRNGLRLNISESEIADAAATSKNKAKAAIAYILQKGYLPTQYADSFAIASGGATFYRNRVNDLVKQGMDQKAAEEQAMLEWQETAEISQQSSDPSKISAQQSSDLGRIILAWANTPMQYARIQKRAIQDLINGRGDAKTNISKIAYYGVAQNIIFNMLQQATFALGFGDDEDEMTDKELEAYQKDKGKKYFNVLNSMLDSTLRGLGIGGAAVSVGKNFLLDIYERSNRKRPEYVDSVWEFTKLSPPIYSKISKLKNAAWNFDNKQRRKMMTTEGFALTNPAYEASAKVITAVTNVPLDRVLNKFNNIQGSLDEDNDMWQRIAMLGGWPEWQLKTSNQKLEDQEKIYEKEPNKYNAWEQVSILKQYKLKKYELDKLKNEDDRVKKILELQKSKNKVFKPLDSDKPWEVKMKEKMKKEGKTDEEIKEAIKAKKEKDKKKLKVKSLKFKKLKIQI